MSDLGQQLPPGVSIERIEGLVRDIEGICGLSDDPYLAAMRVATRAMAMIGALESRVQRAYNMALSQLDLPTATILHEDGRLTDPVRHLRAALDGLRDAAAAYLQDPSPETRAKLEAQVLGREGLR